MPDYNHIAWIYDWLAKIVYGEKQELAKQAFLEKIPNKGKILVVGGGTGKIIDYLRELDKQLEVDFIELSPKMMFYAKKRKASHLRINFHQHSILELKSKDYDVVLTNFFFDQFSLLQAHLILQHLKPKLKPKGIILFSDFIATNNTWDRIVTRIMFYFFQLTTKVRNNNFPPYNILFSSLGFNAGDSKKICRNILASTYTIGLPN